MAEIPSVKNKGGRPPRSSYPPNPNGLQDPGVRAKKLVEVHGTEKVLRALNDEKFLCANFNAYDGMLIIGIGNALKGSGEERERMFNRMFGKVPDRSINLNLNIEATPDKLSARAVEMLKRIDDQAEE